MSHVTISLIVPCWKDDEEAVTLAEKWAAHSFIHEVIVAGVASQAPINHANSKIKRCAAHCPGRGQQMNLGARLATGKVLVFHHVDSILTEGHLQSLAIAMQNSELVGGAFYREFDERHPHLRWLEKFERLHCNSVFIRRDHFWRIGGFAAIPLMEDVDLSRRLRRSDKIVLLDPPMQTSPRKQIQQGAWKVTLRNLLFLLLFRAGVSAHRLHSWYYAKKPGRWHPFRKPIDPCSDKPADERAGCTASEPVINQRHVLGQRFS